ncbi:MAG: ATP-binding protein [Phycisphaerae bacterium]|nr:ATP-binding protein [Phycisphaerae bacterium]
MITRKIKTELTQCAMEYPAVTILGPRQSGKTTLAKMTFPRHSYLSLEDPDVRKQAVDDPRGFLGSIDGGAILDEVQRTPQLLSYLQGIIDSDRRPGRFVLTGSHQPQVHQAISQSLAGRTAVLELLPFTVAEVRRYKQHPQDPFEWIHQGFYPGLHEHRLKSARFFRSYMATYIERDLRTLIQLKDLSQFETFLHLLAGRVGQLVNYASLAADTGVSATTIKNWISILKASYILFELPPWFANIRKRLVKSPKLYFADVGLAAWLLGLETPAQIQRDPLRGHLYENLLIMEVVKNLLNCGRRPQLHFFRDSNGNEVDLLVSAAGRSFTAVEIKSAATFHPEFIKGIEVFRKSVGENIPVDSRIWYSGTRKTTYEGVAVSNPLKHGFAV